jgi:hypothetical protein
MKKLLLLFMMACSAESLPTPTLPDGHGGGTFTDPFPFQPPSKLQVGKGYNGITYHGGPIMLGTINVYYIYYGTWNVQAQKDILETLAKNIGGSAYFNINTTYFDTNHNYISNSVNLAGIATDNYSVGLSLADNNVEQVVVNAFNSGSLPIDSNGVYFVLTSADVDELGFCKRFCGWHTHSTINGVDVKYAFVGNASKCLGSCAGQGRVSPNLDVAVDGMASVVCHELAEIATDETLDAWYSSSGLASENADLCAWNFGTTYTTSNGAKANVSLGGKDFLLQQIWVNKNGGGCVIGY